MTPDQFTSLTWTNTDPVQITGTGEAFATGNFTTSTDDEGNEYQVPIYQDYTATIPLSDMPTDGSDPTSILQEALVEQNNQD